MPSTRRWVGRRVDELEEATGARIAFLTRSATACCPTPDTVLQDGDLLHVVSASDDLSADEVDASSPRPATRGPHERRHRRSRHRRPLHRARAARATATRCSLIDRDADGHAGVPRSPTPTWLLADACELATLDRPSPDECDVVVAATGDDKANLVISLLAKTEFGVPRTVARVNHPKNEWMFDESWGVDVAVSTPRIMTALVEEAVSVGDLVRIFTFQQAKADMVELTLPDDSPWSASASARSSGPATPCWS